MDSIPAQKLNIQNILTNDYLSPYSLQGNDSMKMDDFKTF